MGAISLGVTIGICVGAILWLICFAIASETCSDIVETIAKVCGVSLLVGCTIVGGVIAGSVRKHSYNAYISTYLVTKELIEDSLTNDALGGMERIKLVNEAVTENKTLVEYQYDCRQWYGFLIPEEILELEPINFGGSNG